MSRSQPNMNHQGWMNGNHWAVAHRCDRCGGIVTRLYDPESGSEGNLQCEPKPDGWKDIGGMTLCPVCVESFNYWASGRE